MSAYLANRRRRGFSVHSTQGRSLIIIVIVVMIICSKLMSILLLLTRFMKQTFYS